MLLGVSRVCVVACLLALAMPVARGGATTHVRCPVTVPPPTDAKAPPFSAASFSYGTARLRANIWPHGVLRAGPLPGGGSYATINRDGSIYAKLGWWRGVPGNLTIHGRRLDANAPPLLAEVHNGSYGAAGFIPSGLIFPSVGCWRITGRQGTARLTFVVKVVKVTPAG